MRGTLLAWFRSYLSGRTFRVYRSSVVYIICSYPQGSVLGPPLFIVYTANLAAMAKMYLYKRVRRQHIIISLLSLCLHSISRCPTGTVHCRCRITIPTGAKVSLDWLATVLPMPNEEIQLLQTTSLRSMDIPRHFRTRLDEFTTLLLQIRSPTDGTRSFCVDELSQSDGTPLTTAPSTSCCDDSPIQSDTPGR